MPRLMLTTDSLSDHKFHFNSDVSLHHRLEQYHDNPKVRSTNVTSHNKTVRPELALDFTLAPPFHPLRHAAPIYLGDARMH